MKVRSALFVATVGAASLAGCDTFKKNEDTVGTVSRRVVGMSVGDFLDLYGKAKGRVETADGSAVYDWESQVGYAAPGLPGADEKTCRLRVTADRRGRITGFVIVYDAQGRTGTSRCREIFAAS